MVKVDSYKVSGGGIKYLEQAKDLGIRAFNQGSSPEVRYSGAVIALTSGYVVQLNEVGSSCVQNNLRKPRCLRNVPECDLDTQ